VKQDGKDLVKQNVMTLNLSVLLKIFLKSYF